MGWIVLEDKASDVYSEEVAQELAEMGRAVGSRIEFVDILCSRCVFSYGESYATFIGIHFNSISGW